MIRVLHVLNELNSSGAEVMLETAGRRWEAHGVECDILSTGSTVGPFAPTLERAGYAVHHLPFDGNPNYLKAYISLVRKGRYRVSHVHSERASVYHCLAARTGGAKAVRTVHNSFPFEGALARRRTVQRRLARLGGTTFVAIGSTVAANEWLRFGNPTQRIDNWIDVDRFLPPDSHRRDAVRSRFQLKPQAFVLVTVGNCSPVKNHEALIRALAPLSDVDWHWLHVGAEASDGAERALAAELGLASRCTFLGRTGPLEALHAGDLFVMPSLFEGLPLSPLEAMSTGLPALLTKVPGNQELRGTSEYIYWSSTDADGLREELLRAMSGIQRASEERDTSRLQHDSIAAVFSPDIGVSAYSRLYRSLLTRPKRRDGFRSTGPWLSRSPSP